MKAVSYSIKSAYFHQFSTDFNRRLNLVRDQGVGGSNPLSPTNSSLRLVLINQYITTSKGRSRRSGQMRIIGTIGTIRQFSRHNCLWRKGNLRRDLPSEIVLKVSVPSDNELAAANSTDPNSNRLFVGVAKKDSTITAESTIRSEFAHPPGTKSGIALIHPRVRLPALKSKFNANGGPPATPQVG